ncbi:hypothetical protein I316_07547 [Kwoniella heveanensis BCC8398]|uniref:SWR1-complex protein 5 n=1 Tax=Kwoniella heveanensis BCC8398 TaxID=1296120 RepID=A0A1B9GIC2_9TREE|nr:hypothetical protein I316_07547 [Kwoniella heveanensis BCC8398]
MSTLATANLSSDEEDADFVPQEHKSKSRPKRKIKSGDKAKRERTAREGSASASATSSSSDSGSSDVEGGQNNEKEREAKRLKVEDEVAERRRKAKEEFQRMKAEISGAPALSEPSSAPGAEEGTVGGAGAKSAKVEMVEVLRPTRFAGEVFFERVQLPADDPVAIAYLSRRTETEERAAALTGGDADGERKDDAAAIAGESTMQHADTGHSSPQPESVLSTSVLASSSSSQPAQTPSSAPKSKPKGPMRRKPRQSLEAMSAALDKGKKMTTLEKSLRHHDANRKWY